MSLELSILSPGVWRWMIGCNPSITHDIFRNTRVEIRKLGKLAQRSFELESTFFQDAPRQLMPGVAHSVKPLDTEIHRQPPHGQQCFGGKALSPGIHRQHVAGRGAERILERQARAAEQAAISKRTDQVWTGRPTIPFCIAELQERTGLVDGGVHRPGKISGDFSITRVALENIVSIAADGLPQEQAFRP